MSDDTGYVLYRGKYTRSLLAEMVMAEGGIDYEGRDVDIFKDEHRDPAFLALNPAGFVPALVTPAGDVLHETAAINLYLADRHAAGDLAPSTDDPLRGPFMSGMFLIAGELEPALKRVFYPHRYAVREADHDAVASLSMTQANRWFDHFETRLTTDGSYYLGGRYSLVDLTVAFWAAMLDGDGMFGPYPAVRACLAKVRARRAVAAHFDLLYQWADEYESEIGGSEDHR